MSVPAPPPPTSVTPGRWTTRVGPALHGVLVVVVAAVAHVLLVVGTVAVDQHGSPPTCYGLGWGCTPGPVSSGLLWGMFVVVPATVVVIAVLALTAALPSHRTRRVAAYGVAGTVAAVAVPGFLIAAALWGFG